MQNKTKDLYLICILFGDNSAQSKSKNCGGIFGLLVLDDANCMTRKLVIRSQYESFNFICFMSKGKDRSEIHSDVKIGLAMSLSRSHQRRQLSNTGQLAAHQTISDVYWKRNERLLLDNIVCQMVMMLLHLERYSRLHCRWK